MSKREIREIVKKAILAVTADEQYVFTCRFCHQADQDRFCKEGSLQINLVNCSREGLFKNLSTRLSFSLTIALLFQMPRITPLPQTLFASNFLAIPSMKSAPLTLSAKNPRANAISFFSHLPLRSPLCKSSQP